MIFLLGCYLSVSLEICSSICNLIFSCVGTVEVDVILLCIELFAGCSSRSWMLTDKRDVFSVPGVL